MHCRFIFSLHSAGSVPLIITFTCFAVPYIPRTIHFLLLLLPHHFPNSLTPEAQLWRLLCFLSQFLLGRFCVSTFPMCIIFMRSFHPTCFYKTVQDYLLTFQLCSQGTAGTKSGLTQQSYLLTAAKEQTQDPCLAAQLLVKAYTLVLPRLPTNVTFPERKKRTSNILENKGFLNIFENRN